MKINLTKFDWILGQDVPFKVNPKAVEEFVQFILNSRAWHDDLELVHKRVRRLRRDIEVPEAPLKKVS